MRLVSDSGVVQQWRAISNDGAELPSRQATFRPATVDLGPGETADFEVMFPSRGVATLEVITSPRAPKPMLMRVPVLVR